MKPAPAQHDFSERAKNIGALLLLGLGLLQAVGWATRCTPLRGLGAMSAASPLPFVFSSFRDVETFAADFAIDITLEDGSGRHYALTPGLYSQLDGPYQRRNTYGAVLSYGPALNQPKERALLEQVLRYGFCNRGPLIERFGERGNVTHVLARVTSKTRSRPGEWQLELRCSK